MAGPTGQPGQMLPVADGASPDARRLEPGQTFVMIWQRPSAATGASPVPSAHLTDEPHRLMGLDELACRLTQVAADDLEAVLLRALTTGGPRSWTAGNLVVALGARAVSGSGGITMCGVAITLDQAASAGDDTATTPPAIQAEAPVGLAVEAAEVGLLVTDPDGRVRIANARAVALIADGDGTLSLEVFLSRLGMAGARVTALLDEMRRGLRDRLSVECQIGAAGDGRWLRLAAVADRHTDHALDRVAWTLVDISDQRRETQAAERSHRVLDEALDAMSAGLVLFDAEDRLVFCNSRYREFYGVPMHLTRPGTAFVDMLREEIDSGRIDVGLTEREAWIAERVRKHRNPTGILDQRNVDGRWLQIRERLMTGGLVVGVHVDATAIKVKERQLEENLHELQDTRERLEEQTARLVELAEGMSLARDAALAAARSKAEFLANMSHELRTPLNAILGFSEMLQSGLFGPLSAKQEEYVADIRQSGQHLLSLINDILDLSKAEAGKLAVENAEVPIRFLLERSRRMVAERARRGGLDLVVDLPEPLRNAEVRADERKLTQVLLNLLSNAVKFTDPGGRVELGVRHHHGTGGAGGTIEIYVADTGIGIAAEDIQRVFQPFEQIDSSLSRRYEGTGLGMSLVKAMVDLHDGEVLLESQPGQGTTVRVLLPDSRLIFDAGADDDEADDIIERLQIIRRDNI
ncbi:PAS domain-containing sensor histidine kinase [Tistrella bauzanensis]|uniref:sensor histidine kinase n=1 Tax=Tistrella TaxID=171436 RepID=UPI0031F6980C